MRGGKQPNYHAEAVNKCIEELNSSTVNPNIMVDFSHGNSMKKHENQQIVCENICQQITNGNKNIIGAMIESNLKPGNQKISENMEYGKSVTDACIDFEETKELILKLSKAVIARREFE